jgi:hypothetical protein
MDNYMYDYIKELSKDPIIIEEINKIKSTYNTFNSYAYPNIVDYISIPGTRDTQKWLQAIKSIYYGEKNGLSRNQALHQIIAGWDIKEVYDFLNWLKFYEEGAHLKYKSAQFYYGNADVGYLLPIKKDEEKPAQVNGREIDFAREAIADEMPISEKKRIIEKQRQKIIGRLDSAEKLLRSQEGQIFAANEYESLLETIYQLKKKVQLINKKSASTKLYDDMIVREANILNKKGYAKAADMLYSVAQEALNPPPPPMPTQNSGDVGGLPSTGPGSPQVNAPNNNPTQFDENKDVPKGIADFLQALNTGKLTSTDDNKTEDIEVMEADDDLVVEAQIQPEQPIKPISKDPVIKKNDVKTESDKSLNPTNVEPHLQTKDIDKMINAVFSNLTMQDVVAKFEDIAKFYKTREMPRQLATADMMLDSMGLATFFPSLSEATNKALEANNYISTRIEDILGKLRGTLKTRKIDVVDDEAKPISPELSSARKSLEEESEKETTRKQIRKDLENKALESQMKETPEIEVSEDLGEEKPIEEKPITPTAPVK